MSLPLLLINRGSGGHERGRRPEETASLLIEAFERAGRRLNVKVVPPRELEAAIRTAARSDDPPELLLVAGGDGSISTAAKHLGGTNVPLGIVPLGTFNLAARDLGVPLDLEEAADFLATATPHPIDVLEIGDRACLCTAIIGFYPEFARTFERRDHGGRWWKKALKMATSLPRYFARARTIELSWKTDDGSEGSARTKFSAFVPGRYRATAGVVPERTDFTSGRMTAYIGQQSSAGAAVRGMLDYIVGRQEENPELKFFQAATVTLNARRRRHLSVMVDGEILRVPLPLELKLRPRHLQVLASPEKLTEES